MLLIIILMTLLLGLVMFWKIVDLQLTSFHHNMVFAADQAYPSMIF